MLGHTVTWVVQREACRSGGTARERGGSTGELPPWCSWRQERKWQGGEGKGGSRLLVDGEEEKEPLRDNLEVWELVRADEGLQSARRVQAQRAGESRWDVMGRQAHTGAGRCVEGVLCAHSR